MTISGQSVKQLEAKLKPKDSSTMVSVAFAEAALARTWNRTPAEFEALSEADQILIAAYEGARARLEAVEMELRK